MLDDSWIEKLYASAVHKDLVHVADRTIARVQETDNTLPVRSPEKGIDTTNE